MQQRYNLTDINKRRLTRNYINFEESYPSKFPNSFINQILINYLTYLKNQNLEDYPIKISELIKAPSEKHTSNYRITFNKALSDLLNIEQLNKEQFKKGVVGFSSYTDLIIDKNNQKNKKEYTYYKYNDKIVKWTNFTTNILDRFLSLSQPEREKIYCLKQYNIIKDSLDSKIPKIIRVFLKSSATYNTESNNQQEVYDVKPYKLEIDDNSNSYYLIGYSKAIKSKKNRYSLQCFKLIRIESCELLFNTNGELTEKEKTDADERIDKFGSAFIIGKSNKKKDEDESIIRLTAKGYTNLYLQKKSHNRPIPIEEPKQTVDKLYYDLKFDCSHRQLELYFEQFGKDVTVIKPEKLVKKFKSFFKKAYQNSEESIDEINKNEVNQ